MLIATCLILLADTNPNTILGKGHYSELHVRFVSRKTAVVGRAGPFGGSKGAGKDDKNTYSLLLIDLKSPNAEPKILGQLELTGLDPIVTDRERSSIFELTRDKNHLLVKPTNSPALHLVEIQGNSLRETSRYKGTQNPGKSLPISLVADNHSNTIAITCLICDNENPDDQCAIELCEVKNNRLTAVKNWQFQSLLQETIFKACPLGQDHLVLLTRKRIMALNMKTGKIEDTDFPFTNKSNPGWLSFTTNNGWFHQSTKDCLYVFVNVPGEDLAQWKITREGDKIQFQEMDTVKTFGKTEESSVRYADPNSLILCGKYGDIWKNNVAFRKGKKETVVFESPRSFSKSAPSVLQDQGLILVQEKDALRLIRFRLED